MKSLYLTLTVFAVLAVMCALFPVSAVALVAIAILAGVTLTSPRFRYVAVYRVQCFAYGLWRKAGDWFFSYLFWSRAAFGVFQTTVAGNIGFGAVGEIAFDGPMRARSGITKGTAANIVIGRWFTVDPTDGQYSGGGAGALGGVLVRPKDYSLAASAGNALAPSLVLAAGTVGQFLYMGTVVVSLAVAVNEGDAAKYTTATGVIGVGAPGAGEAAIPNSRFRTTNAAAGLAVLELTN